MTDNFTPLNNHADLLTFSSRTFSLSEYFHALPSDPVTMRFFSSEKNQQLNFSKSIYISKSSKVFHVNLIGEELVREEGTLWSSFTDMSRIMPGFRRDGIY